MSERTPLEIGATAVDFTLKNIDGEDWRLSDHLGQVVALIMYPKDETFVCTKQLCSVRDNWNEYLKTKAVIVGISRGTVEQHRNFANRHRLPLPLLADVYGQVTKTYSQRRWGPIWFNRAIVVVDAKGIIRHRKVMLRTHRPTDYHVISEIYAAQSDFHLDRYRQITESMKSRKGLSG